MILGLIKTIQSGYVDTSALMTQQGVRKDSAMSHSVDQITPKSCAGFLLDLGALGRCASAIFVLAHFPSLPVQLLYWRTSQVRQCILFFSFFLLVFCLTSFVHISFIRYSFYANSDSISTRIPRRTQWRKPFPLILTFEINYSLI